MADIGPMRAPASQVPLSLGFEVVRRHNLGELTSPRNWLDLITDGASPQRILEEVEYQLKGDRPVDLSRWVMEDMPRHEAGFIDDQGDLIKAALLAMLFRFNIDLPEPPLRVGVSVYSARERIEAQLAAIEENSPQIEVDYDATDLRQRASLLREAFRSAVAEHERGQREVVLVANVAADVAESAIRDALEEEWAAGFPRALLSAVGSVEINGVWDRTRPVPTISQLELKEFFIESTIETETMRMMGGAWARAFLAAEATALAEEIGKAPLKSWRRGTLVDRVNRAAQHLADTGYNPTHVLVPRSWRIQEELRSAATSWGPEALNGELGTIADLRVYRGNEQLDGVVVLSLPSAIHIRQELIDGEVFLVRVRAMDDATLAELAHGGTVDATGGPGETPNERLRLRTWVLIREAPLFSGNTDAMVRLAAPNFDG